MSAQRLERSDNPGICIDRMSEPCKGSPVGERFQRFGLILIDVPGLSLRSNRWAHISQRLRRKLG